MTLGAWRDFGLGGVALGLAVIALEDGEFEGAQGATLPVILLVVGFLMFVLGYALRDILGRRKQRAARKAPETKPAGGK